MIVLSQVAPDAFPCFLQVSILRQSNFFLLQAPDGSARCSCGPPGDGAVRRRMISNHARVSRKRVEVNCVPLSVARVRPAPRLPAGRRSNTACSTVVSNPCSRITRNTRFRFTSNPSFPASTSRAGNRRPASSRRPRQFSPSEIIFHFVRIQGSRSLECLRFIRIGSLESLFCRHGV